MSKESALLEEVRAAANAADFARAAMLARDALDEGHEHPLFLNLRAYWLEQQGRADDALTDLRRARTLAPTDPLIGNALGLCFARAGRFWDARQVLRDVTEQDSDFAPAHFNLGWVAEELCLLEEARQAFLRAEKLNPSSASIPARLAYLAARSADFENARNHAARAMALDPNEPMAQLALAICEFEDSRNQAAELRLRRLLSDNRVGPFERALATGLFGDCLDADGRTEQAFATYAACNAQFAKIGATASGALTEPVSSYLSRLTAYFRSTDPSVWKRNTDVAPEMSSVAGHVFLVGFPRSGTTLIEEILAGHPLVCTTGERDGLEPAVREFFGSASGLDRLAASNVTRLLVFREKYWRKLTELGLDFGGKVLVDKQPYNTVKLPLIAKLFPEAKIVFVSRDPRDVVFSCFRSRLSMNASNHDLLTLEGSARLYDSVMRLVDLFRALLALTIHDLGYEDLIDNFAARSATLFGFIGLSGRDAVWDSVNRTAGRDIATPSAVQIAQGLNREGLGAWRRYAQQLAPVMPILQPWIERHGTIRSGTADVRRG